MKVIRIVKKHATISEVIDRLSTGKSRLLIDAFYVYSIFEKRTKISGIQIRMDEKYTILLAYILVISLVKLVGSNKNFDIHYEILG